MVFAHTSGGPDRSDWEPLTVHLEAVARTAAAYASPFGADRLAELTGLLHDLGKAKPAFQAKLRGQENREPHSGEGARYAHGAYGGAGKLMAFCIAGHHAGLPNALGEAAGRPATPLTVRLAEAQALELPAGLSLPPLAMNLPLLKGVKPAEAPFVLQFLTRMLFSALVDADRTETRSYYDMVERRAPAEARSAPLRELRAALDARLARFGSATGRVNRLRAEILGALRAGAGQSPGLFSLTVPTGGGKTLASLAFALDHAIRHGLERVVYVIPYTSIVEQTVDVFRAALGDDDAVLEHHSSFDWQAVEDPGETERLKLAAERWDKPVIVTTAVQFLESLYSNRPARCRKLHRLAKAVVVLDEAQTLPLRLLRPALAAVKELARGYGASVVFCTATQPALTREDGFPAPDSEALSRAPDARLPVRELAPDPERLHRELRRVTVRDAGPLTDGELAARLRAPEGGLVIVNNLRHARALFERVRELPGSFHLTTLMTPAHRRVVLAAVRERLAGKAPVRLVATSLVEAGVDLDFPVVYRALAGIDSIAQAAGRCNREGLLPSEGRVYVFRPDAAYGSPPDIRKTAEIAAHVLGRRAEDPLSPDAVGEYFTELYRDFSHGLDASRVGVGRAQGIMRAIAESGNQCDFPFADIAEAFQVIEGGTAPVIVRAGDYGVPAAVWDEIALHPHAGTIARKLQPYQVQVRPFVRARMLAEGAASVWERAKFEEQFVMIQNDSLYDPRAGLRLDDLSDLGLMMA